MALKIIVVLALALFLVLGIAATKPTTFAIDKSIIVAAPPAKVYPLIADFHNWPQWAPQDREDSTMQRIYSGATAGAGSISNWTSRGSAGSGRMTITAASEPTSVSVEVDWKKPFVVRNTHTFTLAAVPDGTRVTWTANGSNLYVMRVMEVFVA